MSSEQSPQSKEPALGGPAIKFFAVAILIMIGIAIYTIPKLPSSPWSSSLSKPDIQISLRKMAPQFEWSEGGKSLKTADLKGQWTLLSFWSQTCPPCLEELPELNELDQSWSGPELKIITINTDDPNSESFEGARQFVAENNITLPVIYDKKSTILKAFDVRAWPTHFLINPQGEIVWQETRAFRWTGPAVKAALLKVIEPSQPQNEEETQE